jgi:hypothetical protein
MIAKLEICLVTQCVSGRRDRRYSWCCVPYLGIHVTMTHHLGCYYRGDTRY